MLTFFLSSFFVFFYLVLAILFLSYTYFMSLGVWDPKLTNPSLGDRPQLWPVLPPDYSLMRWPNHQV